MRIAIATCQLVPDLYDSEKYLLEGLSSHTEVQAVVWNDATANWAEFNLVIIRSIWDYHENLEAFLTWLQKLEELKMKVLNPINVVKENIHKFYLRDLQDNNLSIIPTCFLSQREAENVSLLQLAEERKWEGLVVKPAISASAWHTYKLATVESIQAFQFPIKSDWLIQPFIKEITTNGEVSLMYFNNQFSHAVVKNAKQGDFRIQKEFGGTVALYEPSDSVMENANKIISYYDTPMLYSRVDGVLTKEGFKIMEVELIEPELYLLNEAVQNKFKEAIVEHF